FDLFATGGLTGSAEGMLEPVDVPAARGERRLFGALVGWTAAGCAGLLLLAGTFYFFADEWLQARLGGEGRPVLQAAGDGSRITSARSVLYPVAGGRRVLVVFGEVETQAAVEGHDLYVVAELRDARGAV